MTCFIALLRAINVGKRQVPMAELRMLVTGLGYGDVQSHVASGNLLFSGEGSAADVERTLDAAISERFGFPVETMVRTADQWPLYVAANPFPRESEAAPNRVLMLLSKAPPTPDAAARIAERAQAGEIVRAAGGAIWIYYADGVGRSKLSPVFIDRMIGSPATGRNISTVRKLAAMAGVAA
ncbi:DUF1697 domain-containing protein [Sphingomonas oleivorans]|nr:DUF1697 domain-containing protein [Sphingomonas oleivorans]